MSRSQVLAGWEARAEEASFKPAELAKLLGYSPNYLRRIFHEKFGRSLSVRLQELRLRRVKQLVDEGVRLKVIARRLGISQSHYLSELFQRATGMTISAYRSARRQGKTQLALRDAAFAALPSETTSSGRLGQKTAVVIVEVQSNPKSRRRSPQKDRKL